MKMTRKQYETKSANLEEQMTVANRVVETFGSLAEPTDLNDYFSKAWNAAHDAVTSLDAELAQLDSEWGWRNVDSNTRALIQQNID